MRKNSVHLLIVSSVKPNFMSDGDGGGVHKRTPSSLTTYLGKSYEIQTNTVPGAVAASFSLRKEARKHIFLGSTRICTKTSELPVTSYELRYYHTDHLGSSNIITDETGTATALYEYTPYGQLAKGNGEDASEVLQFFYCTFIDMFGCIIRLSFKHWIERIGDNNDTNNK